MDVEIRLDGSFPRDISTIHNWLKSGFSLDYIYEQNSTVSGISLNTATGNKISLNGTGLSLEVPYAADENVDGTPESYIAKVSIDTTINDLQNIDPYNSYLDGILLQDIRVDGATQTLLNQISLTMTDQVWSLNIDEAELKFEGNFTGANALHDDPVEVTLDKATLTTNGNKLVEIVEENAQQADGSVIIGDDIVLDVSGFQSGVTEVFDTNVLGTNFDDTLMSEIGGVYLSGGVGNDNIGFISPYHGYHDDTSVLVGGAGADKFYIPVSSYMPPIQIHDFNPAEGDTIELSPSYAIYDGFKGYTIENGGVNFEFVHNQPGAGINLPSTNTFEVGLIGTVHYGPTHHITVSEVGYKLPDNPNNFIQLSQTILTDNNGNPATISGEVKYAELGNGNLAVVWSANKYNSDTFMNEGKHFGRVFDPQTGAFVTDEFRIFSDILNGNIAKNRSFW